MSWFCNQKPCMPIIFQHSDYFVFSFSLALNLAGTESNHILILPHNLYQQILEHFMKLVLYLLRLRKQSNIWIKLPSPASFEGLLSSLSFQLFSLEFVRSGVDAYLSKARWLQSLSDGNDCRGDPPSLCWLSIFRSLQLIVKEVTCYLSFCSQSLEICQ